MLFRCFGFLVLLLSLLGCDEKSPAPNLDSKNEGNPSSPRDDSPPIASRVKISGTNKVGDVLLGEYFFSDDDGDKEGGSKYRWWRDGKLILGAESNSYKIKIDDENKNIKFEVIPVSKTGSKKIGKAVKSSGVLVKEKNFVIIEKVTVGNHILKQPREARQVLASHTPLIVRAYVYNSKDRKSLGPVSLTLDLNGRKLKRQMVCPNIGRNNAYKLTSYDLKETCYSIIDNRNPDDLLFIESGVTLKVEAGESSYFYSPAVENVDLGHIKLVVVPIENKNGLADTYSSKEYKNFLKATYPIADVDVIIHSPFKSDKGFGELLTQMYELQKAEGREDYHYYAVVNTGSCYGVIGLAGIGGMTLAGIPPSCDDKNKVSKNNFLHELGHNFGFGHAPCGAPDSDSFWKRGSWLGADGGEISDVAMFDLPTKTVYSKHETKFSFGKYDLMSYCAGDKLSEYYYNRAAIHIRANAKRYTKPTSRYSIDFIEKGSFGHTVVQLNIDDGVISTSPALLSQKDIKVVEVGSEVIGEYTVDIHTKNMGVINKNVSVSSISHDNDSFIGSFSFSQSAKVEKLIIKSNGRILSSNDYTGVTEDIFNRVVFESSGLHWEREDGEYITIIHERLDNKEVVLLHSKESFFNPNNFSSYKGGSFYIQFTDGINVLEKKYANPFDFVNNPL